MIHTDFNNCVVNCTDSWTYKAVIKELESLGYKREGSTSRFDCNIIIGTGVFYTIYGNMSSSIYKTITEEDILQKERCVSCRTGIHHHPYHKEIAPGVFLCFNCACRIFKEMNDKYDEGALEG